MRRSLLVPAVSTAVMLVILVSLGVWQLHRLAWKTDILARIDAAERSAGVELGGAPDAFEKVHAEGVFAAGLTALYGIEVRDQSAPGSHLLAALIRPGAPALLVDRGWVDTRLPLPAMPGGETIVAGFVHPPERAHWFSATDDIAGRHFYTLAPAVIGAALGLQDVAPYVLVALGPPGVPDPARALPRPPNDHLQYALTWFGFALTLLIIFVLHARKVPRA